MKRLRMRVAAIGCGAAGLIGAGVAGEAASEHRAIAPPEAAQVPSWSPDDMRFFLHGSMGAEIVPEKVLRAFVDVFPDLFPTKDLSHLGLIPDAAFGWPIGISRARPAHLGGLSSVGVNCASCHVGEMEGPGPARVRVLGMTSHFDVEGFYSSVLGAGFRVQAPDDMKRFLAAYLDQCQPEPNMSQWAQRRKQFDAAWTRQAARIEEVMKGDPSGSRGAGPGELQSISGESLDLRGADLDKADLAETAGAMLKLMHNTRAALHVQDAPPKSLPPPSGPGRNDAFGLLSASLFGAPQPYAPSKFGLVWNLERRPWVHWDLNTRSPIGRNLLAALGLGAPIVEREARLDFTLIVRQTALSEVISAPKYPWPIDGAAAQRGASVYRTTCAACHDGEETDKRLFSPEDVGTDPLRAKLATQEQADRFNRLFSELRVEGMEAPQEPGVRSTGKYVASSMAGVWARSPYLHNGTVRTMQELLTPAAERARAFHRGSRRYDAAKIGYADDGPYVLDTTTPGNSNAGHEYGTALSREQKHDLIEYLKGL